MAKIEYLIVQKGMKFAGLSKLGLMSVFLIFYWKSPWILIILYVRILAKVDFHQNSTLVVISSSQEQNKQVQHLCRKILQ